MRVESSGIFSDLRGGQSGHERLNTSSLGVQLQAPHNTTVNSLFGMKYDLF